MVRRSRPIGDTILSNKHPRSALVANLLAHIAFGLLAMTICLPSMQEWGAIFGSSQASVQLTFSAYVVAYGALQLIYGPLSDRLGRRPVLMAGLALAGVGSLAAALSTDMPMLIAARAIQGAGAAAGMVVGRAMVQDLFDGPERTRVMAYVGMVMGVCPPIATIVGGQLHVRLGWQANFVLLAVLAFGLVISAWRGLPVRAKLAVAPSNWLASMIGAYRRLFAEPRFLLYVTIVSLTTATFYAFLAGAPLVLGSQGVGPESIGFYIMFVPISYIVGNYMTSRLIHRSGERRIMQLGQVFTLGGISLMLGIALAGVNTPLAFTMPLMLLGIGHGLLQPPSLSGTVSLLPALAGSAAAVAGLMQQMMGAVGAFAVGLLDHHGAVNLGLLMFGIAACALAAQLVLHRIPGRSRLDRRA